MLTIPEYHTSFVKALSERVETKEPANLYDPVSYILQLGGKRLRPILTLMSTDIFGGNHKDAMDAALAVEVFHNFSLVHDDIMDDAPLRRGNKTVHEKWDLNTGILSGDVMLIIAYRFFEAYEPAIFKELAKLFSKTAIEVCEGQQYDVDFESRDDVEIAEYLKMITCKTAVLVAAAMKMGAIIANAPKEDAQFIYEFGLNLGIAFQLQDDYLDAFGDPERFGKQVGGDIIENKKTFLYLKAKEQSSKEESKQLQHLFTIQPTDPEEKINTVLSIFEESGAAEITRKEIINYTVKAFDVLNKLQISDEGKVILSDFGNALMDRKF
ncbi:polyprenyl synthetase family protein [Ascidiimonas sp. W6]|uniref:polyprenyl synthetase family protein n=1 Tax=Ascidiimonas meishanensis TaxID=3128903 RepID=UPI0030EB6264